MGGVWLVLEAVYNLDNADNLPIANGEEVHFFILRM
jgi:hypothetical protein